MSCNKGPVQTAACCENSGAVDVRTPESDPRKLMTLTRESGDEAEAVQYVPLLVVIYGFFGLSISFGFSSFALSP